MRRAIVSPYEIDKHSNGWVRHIRLNSGWHYPYATSVLFTVSVMMFYIFDDAPDRVVYRGDGSPLSSLSYSIFHKDATHLWFNMSTLIVAGGLFESTESFVRALVLFLTSAPASAAGHALFKNTGVVGGSGYIYAFIAYQLSIAILNWRQMKIRKDESSLLCSWQLRVVVLLVLLMYSLAVAIWDPGDVSHVGHGFGALSGILTGCCIGTNLVEETCEWIVRLAGVLGLCAILCVCFLYDQGAWITLAPPIALQILWVAGLHLRHCVEID